MGAPPRFGVPPQPLRGFGGVCLLSVGGTAPRMRLEAFLPPLSFAHAAPLPMRLVLLEATAEAFPILLPIATPWAVGALATLVLPWHFGWTDNAV